MLTPDEIADLLSLGHEIRGVEFKGPGTSTDKYFLAKVARAAMSLGNLRDGGHVIIGIDDDKAQAMLPGLGASELKSWLAFDDVSRRLAEYADPPLQFEVAEVKLSSGATVAVIQVAEFADVPHLCAKDYPRVLRNGALYVRPRKAPETSEVATSVEMREVLDLATEKALRAYVSIAGRAGVTLGMTLPAPREPSGDELYDVQRDGAWDE